MSFVYNTASIDGGTLYLARNSSVSRNGGASLNNNTFIFEGGVVYVALESPVKWLTIMWRRCTYTTT